jgi:hypothetical protein
VTTVFILLFYTGQYLVNKEKIFIKNFNIHKIFHSKFTEKIAFRKPMFQSRITIFSITTRTPFRTFFLQSFWRLWQHEHRIYIHIWHEVPIGSLNRMRDRERLIIYFCILFNPFPCFPTILFKS